MGIPLVIGVSGHRSVRADMEPLLRAEIQNALCSLAARCPASELVLLSSLAEGADQLAAEVALSMGIRLICPLPLPIDAYRADFSGAARSAFDRLLACAADAFTVSVPDDASRDACYLAAGLYVAKHCHMLIALYDGVSAPSGCGTADVLAAIESNADALYDDPVQKPVLHIITPQRCDAPKESDGNVIRRFDDGFAARLSMLDRFNRDAAGKVFPAVLMPQNENGQPKATRLANAFHAADALSVRCRDRSLLVMRLLSVFGVALVLAFLLYDELSSNLFLLLYAAALAASFLFYLPQKRHLTHDRYAEYRVLAETLRVHFYLLQCNVQCGVLSAPTWLQRYDGLWVREAAAALLIGAPDAPAEPLHSAHEWIDGQTRYHIAAKRHTLLRIRRNSAWTYSIVICSALLFAAALLLEFLLPAIPEWTLFSHVPQCLLPHADASFSVRGALLVLIGIFSAGSAFLANYYGELSLSEKLRAHTRMEALYRRAGERLLAGADRDSLLTVLAREELGENISWLSGTLDHAPHVHL